MFPFNLFKKKEESELPEIDSSMQDNLPVQRDFSSGSGFDKEDLILSKLETINAKLDNIDQRLRKIEEIANS